MKGDDACKGKQCDASKSMIIFINETRKDMDVVISGAERILRSMEERNKSST